MEYEIRGKQRVAVFNALKTPSTGKQILDEARRTAPSMTYQDLRHILRDFMQDGIVVCLNSEHQTGRFYILENEKDKVHLSKEEVGICSQVARSSTRLAVLEEVAKERFFESYPLTATQVRKNLRDSSPLPLGLNHVLSALKFLEENRLVEIAGRTDKRDLKIFQVTELGRSVMSFVSGKNTGSSRIEPHTLSV